MILKYYAYGSLLKKSQRSLKPYPVFCPYLEKPLVLPNNGCGLTFFFFKFFSVVVQTNGPLYYLYRYPVPINNECGYVQEYYIVCYRLLPHYNIGCNHLSKHLRVPLRFLLLCFYSFFNLHLYLSYSLYVFRNSNGHHPRPPCRFHNVNGIHCHRRFCPCRVLRPPLLVSTYRPIKGRLFGFYRKHRNHLLPPIPPHRRPVFRSRK